MEIPDFKNLSLWITFAVFAVSTGAVWIAGTRIAGYADAISEQTGVGQVAVGMVLLGGITSLPEVAVAITSALAQNPALAVNNLLGGVAMQVAILAVADAVVGRQALTVVVASPAVMLQGAFGILLLSLVAAAIAVGDLPLLGIGAWAWIGLGVYVIAVWKIADSQGRQPWIARKTQEQKTRDARTASEDEESRRKQERHAAKSLASLGVMTALAAAVILVAGFLLSRTGAAIAEQTGLGQSFVGAVLLAFSTSLPEISTVLGAVRLLRYEMAISDIFGSLLFNTTLIFVVDAAYDGGPVLNEVGTFSLLAALLGIFVTALYLIGMIERRDRTIIHMGVDSLAVIIVYFSGLVLLYQLR